MKEEVSAMNYKIKYISGHVEVFDIQGRFLFSADTETEAKSEINEMEAA